jgi:hypothetical protein
MHYADNDGQLPYLQDPAAGSYFEPAEPPVSSHYISLELL